MNNILESKNSDTKQIRHERFLPCLICLLFCELDYNLIDGVCVFALRYKGVTQIEQALNYKVALGVGEG